MARFDRENRDIFDEIEQMFRELNREFEDEFDSFFKRFEPRQILEGKRLGPIVYGWSMVVGPDGKPVVRQFGNVLPKTKAIDAEREPLVDINETPEEVSVIAEMPGVDKSDVKLKASDATLEIKAGQKYYKVVELPSKVLADKAKASYKNGVLEVRLPKKEKSDDKPGFQIPID